MPPLERMWLILLATAWIGPLGSSFAVSCDIVSPILPFFWLVIFKVHCSAVRRRGRGDLLARIWPFLKKPMLPTVNCTVLVARICLPFLVDIIGFVYSPTCKR